MSDTATLAPAPAAAEAPGAPAVPSGPLAAAFAARRAALATSPAWWRERAEADWAAFLATPYPARNDERWRFASVSGLAVEGFDPAAPGRGQPPGPGPAEAITPAAARAVFLDDRLVRLDPLPPALAERGVLFLPLERALAEHEGLLREHFGVQATRLGSDKFAALHGAFVRAGMLLHVPAGVEIDEPFTVEYSASVPGGAVFPHTLVIAGDRSRVTLVDAFATTPGTGRHLAAGLAHLFAGDGSQVRYKVFQDWSEEALAFHLVSLTAGRDAFIKNLAVHLGSAHFRGETQSILEGPGSRVETYSLAVTEGTQEIDQRTLQIHQAPHASSDLLFKNALLDTSRTIFSGLIKVAEDAQRTDAYQSNRNLLLSPDAEANSLPGLEIGANDVRCTHGATTSQIDDDELFYMRARGINAALARQLAVFGFFEEVLEKIDHEEIRAPLRAFIQTKFTRHG